MPIGEPSWHTDRDPLDGLHLTFENGPAFVLEALPPETHTGFRVALLLDRPQNPILDTLSLSHGGLLSSPTAEPLFPLHPDQDQNVMEGIYTQSLTRPKLVSRNIDTTIYAP